MPGSLEEVGGHKSGAHPLRQLSGGEHFRAVLARGSRCSSRNFSMRALANTLQAPRLGIVVTRKIARRAVDRNRGKRVVREFFRLAEIPVAPFDIVVQIRSDLRSLNNASLRAELSALMSEFRLLVERLNP